MFSTSAESLRCSPHRHISTPSPPPRYNSSRAATQHHVAQSPPLRAGGFTTLSSVVVPHSSSSSSSSAQLLLLQMEVKHYIARNTELANANRELRAAVEEVGTASLQQTKRESEKWNFGTQTAEQWPSEAELRRSQRHPSQQHAVAEEGTGVVASDRTLLGALLKMRTTALQKLVEILPVSEVQDRLEVAAAAEDAHASSSKNDGDSTTLHSDAIFSALDALEQLAGGANAKIKVQEEYIAQQERTALTQQQEATMLESQLRKQLAEKSVQFDSAISQYQQLVESAKHDREQILPRMKVEIDALHHQLAELDVVKQRAALLEVELRRAQLLLREKDSVIEAQAQHFYGVSSNNKGEEGLVEQIAISSEPAPLRLLPSEGIAAAQILRTQPPSAAASPSPDPAYQAQAVTGDGPLTDGSPLEFDVLSSTRQTASPTVVSSTAPSSASHSPLPASTVAVAIAASPTEASAAASPLLGSGGPPQLDADAQKAFAEWESLRRRAV